MKSRSVSCRKKAHELLEKLIDAKNELWFLHLHTRKDRKSMNSKTLLLLGVVGAVAASTAGAQVYSVNAVGYVNKTCPVGFSMIANPLSAASNTIAALIPNAADGTTIYKWNGVSFDVNVFDGGWSNEAMTLVPGEGVFIRVVGSPLTITFVGEVMTGNLVNPIPAGFSIKSSMVPQAGGLDVLGFPAGDGDTVYRYVGNSYVASIYDGEWAGGAPVVGVGESFWVRKVGAAGSWNRTFSVN